MKSLLIVWNFNGVIDKFGPEIEPTLLRLQAHGAELIVVSSAQPGTIENFLIQSHIDPYFSQVYGYEPEKVQWVGDMASVEKELIEHHLHKFGPYAKIMVIGDSESDIRAGKQLQALTCLVAAGNPTFQTTADTIAHTLAEVESWINAKAEFEA